MVAAKVFAGFCLALCLFQMALIAGAPWGRLTQGGRHQGALPVRARSLAALSIIILVFMALGILSAAGGWPHWPRLTGWFALGITGLSTVANWITPSRPERWTWGPVSLVMLGCALLVLINSLDGPP